MRLGEERGAITRSMAPVNAPPAFSTMQGNRLRGRTRPTDGRIDRPAVRPPGQCRQSPGMARATTMRSAFAAVASLDRLLR